LFWMSLWSCHLNVAPKARLAGQPSYIIIQLKRRHISTIILALQPIVGLYFAAL